MPDSDYLLAGMGGGLKGLIDAYKMKLEREGEDAKLRQSGLNQLSVMRPPTPEDPLGRARLDETIRANKERERLLGLRGGHQEDPPTVEVHGGAQYLVRRGRDGQKIYQRQPGSQASATELAGNMTSLEKAPELLEAMSSLGAEGEAIGSLKRMAGQSNLFGGIAAKLSNRTAGMQEKEGAFITPYLQSGGGKALTPSEQELFRGRIKQRGLAGKKGSSQEGLRDLVAEIAGKTEAGLGTMASGPGTSELMDRFRRVIEANRKAGLLRGELPGPSFAPGPMLPPAADVEDLLDAYGVPE